MIDGMNVQFIGQYLLHRPHAALDISWPVHLSQTASAAIGTVCRNFHPEVDFVQRYCPLKQFGERRSYDFLQVKAVFFISFIIFLYLKK